MAIVIPASDAQSTALNGTITATQAHLTSAIASNNGALVAKLTQDLANAKYALVMHLLGSGHLSSASIIANETYVTQPVADGQ
jgi:hypothetical protein